MTKNFTILNSKLLHIIADNIAWSVANNVARRVVAAAKIAFFAGDSLLTEDTQDLSTAYKKGDAIHALLVEATDFVDGATLDGIELSIIEDEIAKAVAQQFVLNTRRTYKFEKQAHAELSNESDEFFLLEPEAQSPLVLTRNRKLVKDAKNRDIQIRDDRLEYQDIAEAMANNVTSDKAVQGAGDFEGYVDARGKAFDTRISGKFGLRDRASMVNGVWINRFDFEGEPIDAGVIELDNHINQLIDEGIRLKYTMPKAPLTQADLDANFNRMKLKAVPVEQAV